MNDNPRLRAVEKAKQSMRLGSENPVCANCGESNPLRLLLSNGHHLTGRKRDGKYKVILCGSCHLELHRRARLKGAAFGRREGSVKARMAARLRADAQGMPDAQLLLGMAYLKGRDAPHDLVEADAWLQLAAAQGDKLAPSQRQQAEKQMSPDQIAKARALAAAWKPKTAPSASSDQKK